ncbi:hypothetical protein MXB_2870 [Myxobolus squamalis]|nr:hypothetical protein MXB_2870 [Myxobolus squamalis]
MKIDNDLKAELRETYNKFSESGPVTSDNLGELFRLAGEGVPAFKLRDACESMKKSHGETITFDEFIKLFDKLNLCKSKGQEFKQNVQSKSGITVLSGYEATSSGTLHSMSEAERTSFANYINEALKNDPDCKKYLPIDPESEDLFKRVGDGIILCKLANLAQENTIDERAINKTKINSFTATENVTLALNSYKSIGCNIVNVGSEDIKEGRIHLILGIMWQVIRIAMLKNININITPDLLCLLLPGETPEQLFALSPEQLLLRWVNYQLKNVGYDGGEITNFGQALKDSTAYSALEKAIMPESLIHSSDKVYKESDQTKRAQMVIDNAKNSGVSALVSKNDITNCNQKLNMLFLADMFKKYPNLQAVDTSIKIEETREEKSYRNWLNSLGPSKYVNSLMTDLTDGIVLLETIDVLYPGSTAWSKVNRAPYKSHTEFLKKTENCSQFVDLAVKKEFSTVGLCGGDIAKGSRLHILAIVWQLMHRYTIKMLQEASDSDKPITNEEIISWANGKYQQAGKEISISSFKDPLILNSIAVFALIEIIKPGSVNQSLVKDGIDDEEKLLNAKPALC